ncbi:Quinic acid utilization activator [Lecanosticta acicola]|uniref:Quinic acid utilization activator n=1 Tax=Lecanosticta acicola TaxID=111012 RepID=A0AAI8Z108_9PEZI|nr:Quinic acid utilization activator [Lecanosticta acicola]
MNHPPRTTPSSAGDQDNNSSGGKRTLDSTGSSKKSDRSKRFRVSRACDQCRAGRERCDGAQPSCQTCETQDRPCTYHEPPKKRGIQPNYIRTLELTLAWLFKTLPEGEKRLSELLPSPDDSAHRLIAFKDVADAEALHQLWRNGIVCRQIDQLLSGAEIETPTLRAEDSGRPGTQNGVAYQSPPLSAQSESGVPRYEAGEVRNHALVIEQSAGDIYREAHPGSGLLKLPENAWALLEEYFAFTHTWLPITEKHDILRLMYTYPEHGLLRESAQGSEHAELWSIMAYATSRAQKDQSSSAFHSCQDIAKSLIPRDQRAQLGHAKALLILSLISMSNEAWVAAWLTVGSAVRLLTHLFPGNAPSEPALAQSRAKHAYLAAYLLESVVASHTNALLHLRTSGVRDIGLLVEDGMEEWSPWHDPSAHAGPSATKSPARSISSFNELVRIALRSQNDLEDSSPRTGGPRELDVIVELLRNAASGKGRLHPSFVISKFRQSAGTNGSDSGRARAHDAETPALFHARTNSSQADFWANPNAGNSNPLLDQQYPFMTIPIEGSESLPGSTPAQQGSGTNMNTNMWAAGESTQLGLQNMPSFATENAGETAGPGADIFEELAMLERTESSQNPKFMQNLGFGPDLDLAEFFGADYQPSDPLLAYMQPNSFGDISQSHGGANKDAG